MRPMIDREKKLLRYGSIGIVVYLALFFIWKPVQKRRDDYEKLVAQAEALRDHVRPYEDKAVGAQHLMETFQFDPIKLSKATLVGEASAAIQKAAMSSGIQVGPVRESTGRAANKELASLQFEGMGQVPAIMGLLKRLETLGYPMIIDSVQITPIKTGPGMLKLNLTIAILDFEQMKSEEKPHA